MDKIVQRILGRIRQPGLLEELERLPPSDVNSLLLAIGKLQTDRLRPADLLRNYRENRFASPSALDPARYYQLEADMTRAAEARGIGAVLLSPAAPLGSCSVFGCVDQNNVLSAVRSCEVLADASNLLALYLADRIAKEGGNRAGAAHVCAVSRFTRAQAYAGKDFFAHFGVFCLASAGRDTGSYGCETELLAKQLSFYRDFFRKSGSAPLEIVLRRRGGYKDPEGFFSGMLERVRAQFPDLSVTAGESDPGNTYYRGLNFKLYLPTGEGLEEVGDGGFVDWTQQLLGSRKERCLISGVGVDRLLLLEETR
jgi:hypothetical protein